MIGRMGNPDAPRPLVVGPAVLAWGTRTWLMGILNVTPDSFSGDGLLAAPDPIEAGVAQARRMVADGADLLDVGGASSRPGHTVIDPDEEAARVVPVIRAIHEALPATPLSVDTTSPAVARLGPVVHQDDRHAPLGRDPEHGRVVGDAPDVVEQAGAGVDIVRVHDVRENLRAARTADAILRGWRPEAWEGGA